MTDLPMLEITGLQAWYGESHVLHGMDLTVDAGEVVTLLGRNGAGKTTTLRSIMGLLRRTQGSVRNRGTEIRGWRADKIARRGLAYCPEERGIFAGLNVSENLMLPPCIAPGGISMAEIERMFPNLLERRASPGTRLSGGEQQMLAIARILRTGAKVLLLDEPTEGLAPVIVKQIGRLIAELRQRGYTILLVEQNFHFASALADRHYLVEHGRVVDMLLRSDIAKNASQVQKILGI